ncbi:MAG TPA: Imm44 family immunity protein [Isosphaeraceae bacterium]|jgi:hypothetical protein|nr:Imm44 family immunity protein [Isosphaeraceae bacterium]
MEFWMSGEVEADVSDQFLEALRRIEGPLTNAFKEKDYGSGLSEWDFIPVIMSISLIKFYKEIKKYNKIEKSCEFRLHINHDRFRLADERERADLLCRSMLRSLDMLEFMNIQDIDVDRLKSDFLQVATANDWLVGMGNGDAASPETSVS